jgi:tetratricopeptide (TPR) repeat protein
MNPGSLEALRGDLEQAPSPRRFVMAAEDLRSAGRVRESIEILRDGMGRFPRSLSPRIALGKALHGAGNHGEALVVLREVLKADPENSVALQCLALVHEALDQPAEALGIYRQLRPWLPPDADLEAKISALERQCGPGPTPKARRIERLKAYFTRIERARSL